MTDFNNCLGRTCLKWSADGELTSVDLLLVLERLAQVDQEVRACAPAALIASLVPRSAEALPPADAGYSK